jgi:hypothetical protein
MVKFHPFAQSKSIGMVVLQHVILEGALKLIPREYVYEPEFESVFDKIRYHAERAGLSMEDVRRIANGQ